MQGINRNQHGQLVDALGKLQELLAHCTQECSCRQQSNDYSRELTAMYDNYNRLLKELSDQIIEYEILYQEIKVKFLGKKLKALKKEAKKSAFQLLTENNRLAYGT